MSAPPVPGPDAYEHLRVLAARIHAERGCPKNTLQPTALLHEAWMKLANSSVDFASKEHFYAVAAASMRQILVDRYRARSAVKRDGDRQRVTLSGLGVESEALVDLLDLDAALTALASVDPRAARLIELRVFGGLNMGEVAKVLDCSERTAHRRWRFGKAFVARMLDLGA